MDILIHLSRREGLPRALPQAMAAAKPIVALNYDGAREVCLNEKTGLLVEKEDLPELARSILRLAKDKKLQNSLGQAGRDFVQDKFTLDQLVNSQYQLYQRLFTSN